MTGLRDELLGRNVAPTPYRMLCPPGWRRVSPEEMAGDGIAPVLDAMKANGRADLVLEMRRMLTDFSQSVRQAQTVDVYLAPVIDDAPIPATMLVNRFRLPEGVSWEDACSRLAKGGEVWEADFTETPMWTWVIETPVEGGDPQLTNRVNHYLVPVPEEPSRRALYFQFSLLEVPSEFYSEDGEALRTALRAYGDLMMSTMRWMPAEGAGPSESSDE